MIRNSRTQNKQVSSRKMQLVSNTYKNSDYNSKGYFKYSVINRELENGFDRNVYDEQ